MKLTVFNCSPKKGKNNTGVLTEKFIEGFLCNPDNKTDIYKLNQIKETAEALNIFKKAECVIIAFPLYVYAMPSGVKEFIENLEKIKKDISGKKIIFLIQAGFPEALHIRPIEKYLEMISIKFNFLQIGTILKGGCSELADKPESNMNRKTLNRIYGIGKDFGTNYDIDPDILKRFSRPEKIGPITKIAMHIYLKFANIFYWKALAAENGALEKINARPYAD